MAVVDKAWDGSAGRFTDDQYERSCVLDRKGCGSDWADKPPKTRCSLPIKEPNGDLNRNAVHAAAGRIGSVTDACPSAVDAAKAALRSAYKQLGEDAPASIDPSDSDEGTVTDTDDKNSADLVNQLERYFGVKPGVPRHGEIGIRGVLPFEFRDASEANVPDGYLGTLNGYFAVFNRWTEIDSFWEGRFLESIQPGAFKKTFQENMKGMRCLVQHGRDPSVGLKPLGPIRSVSEDDYGARYEVSLLDTSYNRDLLPGLKDDLYGASFRFQVVREEVNSDPERASHNPDGIEERKLTEVKVSEFGPVTFPAYADATAGVRSLVDVMVKGDMELFLALTSSQRFREKLHSQDETESRVETKGTKSDEENTAPPRVAPTSDKTGATRLRAPRVPLRTTKELEEPPWKL